MIQQKGPWVFNNDQNSGYLDIPYLVLERDGEHFFRKYSGFSISKEVYDFAQARNVRYYEVHYLPSMKVFIFNLADFKTGYKVYFSGEIQYILPVHRAISEFVVHRFGPAHIDSSLEVRK